MRKTAIYAALATALILGGRLAIMAVAPLFEPSEARYATISANMARCGDWFTPSMTCNGVYQPFAGKPPLLFQSAAGVCKAIGVNEFAVRLVPFLSFLGLLGILYFTVKRTATRTAALLAVAACATSVALYATAGFCMFDVPLTMCVSGALLLYSTRECWFYIPIAILLALGTLVKGPVALALFGLPVLVDAAVQRRWPQMPLGLTLGAIAAYLLICIPYFAATEARQSGFLKYFFVNENLLRFLVHDYGDKYGAGRETFRGMAIVWTLVVTLPWSLVPVFKRKLPSLSFHMTAILTMALFWSLTSRVPLPYLLPAVPLFAAHLATRTEEFRLTHAQLAKLVIPAAAICILALGAGLGGTWLFKRKKMPGADALPKVSDHYFSYEFYHGPWGEGAKQ